MPVYHDVPVFPYYPHPERFLRQLREGLKIESILDIGAGHGGVFDLDGWTNDPIVKRREACDLVWIRPTDERWTLRTGIDATKLTDFYPEKSFDCIQCIETLEHIPDNRKALEEMCKVAKKLVFITSCCEGHHCGDEQDAIEKINPYQAFTGQPKFKDMIELGFTCGVEKIERRQIIAWKIL